MEGSDDKPRDRAAKHSPLSQPSSAFQKKKKTLAYESFNSRNKNGKPGLHDVS